MRGRRSGADDRPQSVNSGVIILIIIVVSTFLQCVAHWFSWGKTGFLLSLGLLCLFLFLNTKVFPGVFLPDSSPGEMGGCAFSYEGFGTAAFMLLGNALSVLAFALTPVVKKQVQDL